MNAARVHPYEYSKKVDNETSFSKALSYWYRHLSAVWNNELLEEVV